MAVNYVVFFICALICLLGATGVVFSRNPVHAALSLVATLFGIAVLFVQQSAHFLAAVQVIVYTGAIVVLILFVMMLLGVDQEEDIDEEPLLGVRAAGTIVATILLLGLLAVFFLQSNRSTLVTGERSVTAPLSVDASLDSTKGVAETAGPDNMATLGRLLFTRYVFAFEVTAALLTIAVVGAVVLARRPDRLQPVPDEPESMDDDFMAALESEAGH